MPITELTVNTAEVTGTDPGGGTPTDTSFAGAVPYLPGIAVTKTPSPTEVAPGDSVTYTVRGDQHRQHPAGRCHRSPMTSARR